MLPAPVRFREPPHYTPADDAGGKFLRAWASCEKNGMTHRVQTKAIGTIMAASAATATDAAAPLHLPKAPGEAVEAFK